MAAAVEPDVGLKFRSKQEPCPDVVKLPEHFHEAESHIDEFRPFFRGLKFLTPVRRDWLCAHCQVLLLRAWKASCGHHFCGECVVHVILATQFSCPRDDDIIWNSEFCRSEEVETEVSRTFVVCPFGCGSAYPAYELVKHKSNCPGSPKFLMEPSCGPTVGSWARITSTKGDKNIDRKNSGSHEDIKQDQCGSNIRDKKPGPVRQQENPEIIEISELKKEVELLKKTIADTKVAVEQIKDGCRDAVEQLRERVAILEDQLGCVVATRLASSMPQKPYVPSTKTAISKSSDIGNSSQKYSWTVGDIRKKLASADGTLVEVSEEIFVDDSGLSMQVELCLKCLAMGDSEENRQWRLVTSSMVIKAVDSPLIESGQWPIRKHVQVELISPLLKRQCTAQGTHYFQKPSLSKLHQMKFDSFIDRKVFVEQILPQDFMVWLVSFRDGKEKDRKRHSIPTGGSMSFKDF